MGRDAFIAALRRGNASGAPVFGTGTSIACRDLMRLTDAWFPAAHTDAETMAALAIAAHTILGFEAVMPLFSVCHEAAALGCSVNWGGPDAMPESGPPVFGAPEDIRIPVDFTERPGCAVPLRAIALLKRRLGGDAAVCGKVFGAWTLAYHCFGIENFLMLTLDDPDAARRILDRLTEATLRFARAQIEAGADCLLLGDHATRDLCGPAMYTEFLEPLHARLAAEIECPLILHICGNTADRIAAIARTGLACFHYDTTTGPPAEARRAAGDRLALMGGISNFRLLRESPEIIARDTAEARDAGIDIIGPECAVPLATPLANLLAINKPDTKVCA